MALAMGALVLLCVLFILGRPWRTAEHEHYRASLREVRSDSVQIAQSILRERMGLEGIPSSWPNQFASLREKAGALKNSPRFLLAEERQELERSVTLYLSSVDECEKLLAHIQEEDARAFELRNRLTRQVFFLAGRLGPQASDTLAELLLAARADEGFHAAPVSELEEQLEALASVPRPPELEGSLQELQAEAREMTAHQREANSALRTLLAQPANDTTGLLIARYQQFYDAASQRATRAHLLLFSVSLVLGGFVTFVLVRLGKTGRMLDTLNQRLEQRVDERTAALSVANQELRASAARKAAILEGSLDCIITLDETGHILEFNPAAELTFRLPGATAVGRDFQRLALPATLPEGSREMVARALRADAEPGRALRLEMGLMRADGSLFPAELTIFRVRGDGAPRFSIYLRDISERKEVERMKNEFISTVSHELRTPLTSIRGSLGLLENGIMGTLPPQAEDMVRIARTNTERLIRLINDILDLEKIESGKLELKWQALEPSELIDATFSGLRGMADTAQVTLRSSTVGAGLVRGDRDRLIQVLTNLVSNAIKFSPPRGVVKVSATRDARGAVRFSIVDRGPGISTEQLGRLFGKFQQLDGSDTRSKGGTGLGLAISQSIIEQHGGHIEVNSVPGEGATFTFTVSSVSMESASVPAVRDDSRHSILMVTADESLYALLRGLLKLEGYRVLRTTSLQEASRMIEAGAPDALMLDTELSDGNGMELVRQLREAPATHTLPILVVSSHLPESEGVVAPLAINWLVKPFDETRFLNTLRSVLRPPGKARVLVVDDDVSLRHILGTLLERMGAQFYEAADGDSAVELAREKPPDLIILDVNLPRMDGFEVVDLLRQGKSRTTPLIVFTGRELSADEQRQLTLGTTCILHKARSSEGEMAHLVKEFLNGLLSPGSRPVPEKVASP